MRDLIRRILKEELDSFINSLTNSNDGRLDKHGVINEFLNMYGVCKNAHKVDESRIEEFITFLTNKVVKDYVSLRNERDWVKQEITDTVHMCRNK
jgi:hypothetical protein